MTCTILGLILGLILGFAILAIIPATVKWWGTDGFGGPP
jgi:hypothetical protein